MREKTKTYRWTVNVPRPVTLGLVKTPVKSSLTHKLDRLLVNALDEFAAIGRMALVL